MAKVHGKDSQVFLDDAAGTPRELTSFVTSIDTSWSRAVSQATAMGQDAHEYLGGIQDGTFSLNGRFDAGGTATPDQWLIGLLQAAGTVTATFTILAGGSAAGLPFDRGECFITDYSKSDPYDDVVTWSADFQVTGAVTRGTV